MTTHEEEIERLRTHLTLTIQGVTGGGAWLRRHLDRLATGEGEEAA